MCGRNEHSIPAPQTNCFTGRAATAGSAISARGSLVIVEASVSDGSRSSIAVALLGENMRVLTAFLERSLEWTPTAVYSNPDGSRPSSRRAGRSVAAAGPVQRVPNCFIRLSMYRL